MKIPTNITIGSVSFAVRVLSAAELWADGGDDLLGQSKYSLAELQIRAGMPPERTASILLHEAFHAIATEYGYELSETVVRTLASSMFALLRQNPDFTAYLMNPEAE